MYNRTDQPGFLQNLLYGCMSAIIGLIVALFLCFPLSILISNGTLNETTANFSYLTTIPGALLCGFMTAHHSKKHRLPFALMSGIVFFLLLFLIGLIFLPTHPITGNFTATIICISAGSLLGGVLASR